MTEQEQRIAIAEACGFTRIEKMPDCFWDHDKHRTRLLQGTATEKKRVEMGMENTKDFYLPDYLHDLNAMHEAEKVLTEEQQAHYTQAFHTISGSLYWQFLRMTATQRAEAFLRTVGKWTT